MGRLWNTSALVFAGDVVKMQARRWLVENVERADGGAARQFLRKR